VEPLSRFHRKPNVYVSQIDLRVENLTRSILFYQNIIGLQILEQSETKAIFSSDGKTALLAIEQSEDVIPKQPRTTGLFHFALLLPNRQELGKYLGFLLQSGYPLQGASDHLVSEALYLADPDGNGIEIYIDRPSSTWNWRKDEVVMTSEPLDVESLLAEGKSGSWKGLPVNTLMGHIHLHVSELERTKEFYCDGLGFNVVNRYGSQALFISSGTYHHHIGLNTWNGMGAPKPLLNSVGLIQYNLVFPNEEERLSAVERLGALGYAVLKQNGETITEDPSGNRIQLLS
jgi:catechol 2,3-dioxygenase